MSKKHCFLVVCGICLALFFLPRSEGISRVCNLNSVIATGMNKHYFFMHSECSLSCIINIFPVFDIPVLISNGTLNTTSLFIVQVINPLI